MSDLIIMAIGLVLGGLCVATWVRIRELDKRCFKLGLAVHDAQVDAAKAAKLGDQLNTHDHEIGQLYDKTGLRRQ